MRSFSTILLVFATLATLSFTAPVAMDVTIADALTEVVEEATDVATPIVDIVDKLIGGSMDMISSDDLENGSHV
ncbi:hypothetical protein H2248_005503 [Termitomyces sp. 'cryptogamus']|nr:hypothetical protein H2248_005503 [Termitomyces sp. 'cryptogamus']